jgi:hypothetical protein
MSNPSSPFTKITYRHPAFNLSQHNNPYGVPNFPPPIGKTGDRPLEIAPFPLLLGPSGGSVVHRYSSPGVHAPGARRGCSCKGGHRAADNLQAAAMQH